jgi:predicted nucleotide-binding protein
MAKTPGEQRGPTLPPQKAVEVLRRQLQRGEDLAKKGADISANESTGWMRTTSQWLEKAFGKDSQLSGAMYDAGPHVVTRRSSPAERAASRHRYHLDRLDRLRECIQALEDEIEVAPPAEGEQRSGDDPSKMKRVFVVHGHDDALRETVCRFLEQLGLEPIVLMERPNGGRTIIEKLESEGARAGYAVVLLTPDDVGGLSGDGELQRRARQNVIFELGLFVGQLGRSHVCVLKRGEVETLSDLHGVLWVPYNGNWKLDLVREMKAAGVRAVWDRLA